jgi:hypothetical protein
MKQRRPVSGAFSTSLAAAGALPPLYLLLWLPKARPPQVLCLRAPMLQLVLATALAAKMLFLLPRAALQMPKPAAPLPLHQASPQLKKAPPKKLRRPLLAGNGYR